MRVIIVLTALVLAGCATPCPAPNTAPTTTRFHCEDGSNMVVTFSHAPERALIEQEGYTSLNLAARIVGSGFRFSDGGAELRGRTNEVHWTRPGAAETICRAVQTPQGS